MFCTNCGKELDNNARFCPYCGSVITADAPQFPPAANPAPASYGSTGTSGSGLNPQQPKPRGWGKILIGAAAGVLVAALAVGLAVSGVFSSDKSKVMKAAAKSASAYAAAAKDAGLPDLKELTEGQQYSQSVEIALENVDLGWYGFFFNASALEGIGVRVSTNYDLPGEKLSASATPFYGSADLLTAELVMDGSKVYVSSPELTGGVSYGLDTMTLGRDLQKLGAGEDVVGDLSFNVFQLVKKMRETAELDAESRNAVEDAARKLYKAIEVEKTGTENVMVNSGSVKCDAYTVVIPEEAVKDYLRAVRSAASGSLDYRELFSSTGLPDEVVDEILNGLYGAGPEQSPGAAFNGLEEMADMLGGVELRVYVSRGYIMAVTYSGRIGDAMVKAELNLGGGENYADDMSLRVSANDYEIVLNSHGNHSAAGGTFTDETVLKITGYGYSAEVSSGLSYSPKQDRDNFSWHIVSDGVRIDMAGQLTTGRNSMELHLEELVFRISDVSVTLRADYSIGSYQGIPSVTSPVMLSTLDEDKLLEIMDGIRDSAADWAYNLTDEIPGLRNFVGAGGVGFY